MGKVIGWATTTCATMCVQVNSTLHEIRLPKARCFKMISLERREETRIRRNPNMDEGRRKGGCEVRGMLVGKNNTWRHSIGYFRHTHTYTHTYTHVRTHSGGASLASIFFAIANTAYNTHPNKQNNKHAKPFLLRRTRSLSLSSSFSLICEFFLLPKIQTNHQETTAPTKSRGTGGGDRQWVGWQNRETDT